MNHISFFFRRLNKTLILGLFLLFCGLLITIYVFPLFTISAVTFLAVIRIVALKLKQRGISFYIQFENYSENGDAFSSVHKKHEVNPSTGIAMSGPLVDAGGNAFGD